MFGIDISDPAMMWTVIGVLVSIVFGVIATIIGRQQIHLAKNAKPSVQQTQKLGDDSKGYQAGGDIHISEKK